MWCIASGGVTCVVVTETELREIVCPLMLLLSFHCTYEVQQCTVKPLTEPIACLVIRCQA